MQEIKEMQIITQQQILKKDFKIYGSVKSPLFLAKYVANWIEHSDVSTLFRNIDDDEKVTNKVSTPGGIQKAINVTNPDGSVDVQMETKWTQKGRLFIYELLKEKGFLPTMEREK